MSASFRARAHVRARMRARNLCVNMCCVYKKKHQMITRETTKYQKHVYTYMIEEHSCVSGCWVFFYVF
jgi:hypothetical protein